MGCFDTGGTDVKQESTLTKGQRSLLDQLTSLLGGQLGQSGPTYSGQTTAGMNPLQQQGLNAYAGVFDSANQGNQLFGQALGSLNPSQGQATLSQGQGALDTMLADFDPTSAMNFFEKSIKNPTMQTWQKDVMPSIMEKFAGNNAVDSGAMQRELARSGTDMMTNLNGQLANVMYSAQNDQLGRQQQGVNQSMNMAMAPGQLAGQYGNLADLGLNQAGQAMNAGTVGRGIEQEGLTDSYNKWLSSQGYNNPWLTQYLSQALGVPAFENVATEQPMGLGTMLTLGGMNAAGSYFGAQSDRRLKENIVPNENALDKVKKLKAYFYNFKGKTEKELGLMAQDVQEVLPEGVSEQNGILHVKTYAIISLLVDAVNELSLKMER